MEKLFAVVFILFLVGIYFWQTIDLSHTASKWEKEDKNKEDKNTPEKYS